MAPPERRVIWRLRIEYSSRHEPPQPLQRGGQVLEDEVLVRALHAVLCRAARREFRETLDHNSDKVSPKCLPPLNPRWIWPAAITRPGRWNANLAASGEF